MSILFTIFNKSCGLVWVLKSFDFIDSNFKFSAFEFIRKLLEFFTTSLLDSKFFAFTV